MKPFKSILASCLLLSMLVSCTAKPSQTDTSADSLGTLPPIETTESTESATSETTMPQTTTVSTLPEVPYTPNTYDLTYLNQTYAPSLNPQVETLQWRNGDGTKRYFTVVSRIYNNSNEPIIVSQPTISVTVGNKKGSLCQKITPYYLMPYQTGFVVVRSDIDADSDVKLEKVKYTYDIPTKEAQNEPVQYAIESATANAEYRNTRITGIDFHIVMRDPPETRFIQVNVVLYNKDGVATEAFSQKITQRDGKFKITHYPDMSIDVNDVASFSVTLTSQCNEK